LQKNAEAVVAELGKGDAMPIVLPAGRHGKAVELAEAGKYQDALDVIEQHLDESPEDAEALNDAAVLLHCLDRSDMAVEYLERARQLSPGHPEMTWNLVEALLAEAQVDKAKPLFSLMEKAGILSMDVLNRAANIFLSQGNLTAAAEMLEWSLRLDSRQEILKPMIEVIHSKMAVGQGRSGR
jgi:tetratricopeptide (TPR) repeat protein